MKNYVTHYRTAYYRAYSDDKGFVAAKLVFDQ